MEKQENKIDNNPDEIIDYREKIIAHFNNIIQKEEGALSFLNKLKNLKEADNFENIFTSFERCPDHYVGEIDGQKFILAEDRYRSKKEVEIREEHISTDDSNNVVILLESPHIDEFQKKFTAPAMGETGIRINNYIEILLKRDHIIKGKSKLFLVNAIQYQCSLGYSTDCVRNHVFKFLFNDAKILEDLKIRINRCCPSVILVATTSFCRQDVNNWLLNEFKDSGIAIYEADSHPSVWTAKTKIVELN